MPPRRRPSAPPTTSTPKFCIVNGTGLPGITTEMRAVRKMSSAPAMTRPTLRRRGDVRSPTRTGTRKSAIIRPFSATGSRLSDGIA